MKQESQTTHDKMGSAGNELDRVTPEMVVTKPG